MENSFECLQVSAVLTYIQELGFSSEELQQLLSEFPFVLACEVEKRLKPNVLVLTGKWRMKPKEVRSAIMRNPLLLGYTLDCEGDCKAECDYCWARF